jgi:hypothetical protein
MYKFTVTTPEGEHKATSFKAAKRIAKEHGPGCKIRRIERHLKAYYSRINGVERREEG